MRPLAVCGFAVVVFSGLFAARYLLLRTPEYRGGGQALENRMAEDDSPKAHTAVPRLLWGAYAGDESADAASFESLVGEEMDLRAIFISWKDEGEFPAHLAETVRDRGQTLVIFWESDDYAMHTPEQPAYGYDAILRGDFDEYIRRFSAAAKVHSGPVILIPFHEMNGNWSAWSGTRNDNSPEKHKQAFRHLKNLFRESSNVRFGWAVNNDSVPDTAENQFENYYPGDEHVDYVGIDGFNFGSPWQAWSEVFASGLRRLAVFGKPIYIFSMSSAEGSAKAEWIRIGLGTELRNYPNVAGWIWFNENKERDWRVNSDEASLKAFQEAVAQYKE